MIFTRPNIDWNVSMLWDGCRVGVVKYAGRSDFRLF